MKIQLKEVPTSNQDSFAWTQHNDSLFVDEQLIVTEKSNSPRIITNCYFKDLQIRQMAANGQLTIQNCVASKLRISTQGGSYSSILLENILFNELLIEGGAEQIVISKGRLDSELELPLDKVISSNGSITLLTGANTKLELNFFSLRQIKVSPIKVHSRSHEIKLNEVKVEEESIFSGVNEYRISKSILNKLNIICTDDAPFTTLAINDNSIVSELDVDNCNYLSIIDSKIEKSLKLNRVDSSIIIKGSELNTIQNKKSPNAALHQVSLLSITSSDNSGKIKRSTIDSLNLGHGVSSVSINQSDINFIQIQDKPSINFDDVKFGLLKILNADLSNVVFNRVSFKNGVALGLIIQNSTITTAKFQAVQWPKDHKIIEDPNSYTFTSREDYCWNLREGYRQLKVLSTNSHNKIDAGIFLRHELDAYFKYIRYVTFKDGFSVANLGNFLILGSNKLFSDFGNNIWIPLGWLFFFHFLFVLPYLPDFNLAINLFNWDGLSTLHGFDLYMTLLSPIHSSEIYFGWMKGKESITIAGLTDSFMRIFSSYFIFYFIKATRKYHFGL